MSSILKKPPISQKPLIVTALPMVQAEPNSNIARLETKDRRCERCLKDMVKVMETNLLAAAKHRAVILERESKKRAEDIMTKARQQAAQLRQEATDKGHREGYQAGFEAGQETARELVDEARELLAKAREEKARLLTEAEPEALELAFQLAGKILRREVTKSPEALAELLKAAADKLPQGEPVVVEVAPGEKQLWHEAEETLRAAMSDRPFEIAENATVPPAEFMLSSAVGTVDARLQPQLEVCRTHLLGEDV
ncbi:MAG TPA: hypothetical protein GX016_08760 [Firmicutes bacterium]|nr:hypothetical protein [Bacillota bacterium]